MIQFAVLTVVTILAVSAAIGLNWVLLRAAFHLMQPAGIQTATSSVTRNSKAVHSELVHGTRAIARQFAAHH
jgi:hypothetical protein